MPAYNPGQERKKGGLAFLSSFLYSSLGSSDERIIFEFPFFFCPATVSTNFKQQPLNRHHFILTVILTLTFTFNSSYGQLKKSLIKSNKNETTANQRSRPKITKNHFLLLPDEFLFVQCGLQDKAGNMWFGSAGDGIYFYDGKSFINFTRSEDLNLNDILCCMQDKSGTIWFGTRRGLIRYTPSGTKPVENNFTTFKISENIISNSTRKKIPDSHEVNNNFVWSILQDKSGKIWFGTNKGVYIYTPVINTRKVTPAFTHFLDNESLRNNYNLRLNGVTSMIEDEKGNIWFVANWNEEGICRYDGSSLINFKPDSLKNFRSILKRKNGNLLFLNGFHGVYSYDGNSFTKLDAKIGMKNGALITMMEDKDGIMWFGTNSDNLKNGGDGGVLRYDGKLIKLFTTKDGLSHNCVFTIVEDKNGNIWFGTRNTGLCRYDGKTFTDFTE